MNKLSVIFGYFLGVIYGMFKILKVVVFLCIHLSYKFYSSKPEIKNEQTDFNFRHDIFLRDQERTKNDWYWLFVARITLFAVVIIVVFIFIGFISSHFSGFIFEESFHFRLDPILSLPDGEKFTNLFVFRR